MTNRPSDAYRDAAVASLSWGGGRAHITGLVGQEPFDATCEELIAAVIDCLATRGLLRGTQPPPARLERSDALHLARWIADVSDHPLYWEPTDPRGGGYGAAGVLASPERLEHAVHAALARVQDDANVRDALHTAHRQLTAYMRETRTRRQGHGGRPPIPTQVRR